MKAFLILAFAPFVYCAATYDVAIDKHVEEMQDAQSLSTTFTVTKIGGTTEEQTLLLSRPDRFKWETPSMLIVADGKHITTYNKATKTYTEADETEDATKKILSSDAIWIWSAFNDKDFAQNIENVDKGSSHKVRDVAVTDYTVTRKDKRTFNIQIEDATGIARGAKYTSEDKADVIMLAKTLKKGESTLDDAQFTFVAPEGATKATEAPATADALKYSDVASILNQNCAGCHGGGRPKAGIDLSSYSGISNARIIVPGDPGSSKLIRVIKSGKMPPGGPLPADKLEMLSKWVAGGAKE